MASLDQAKQKGTQAQSAQAPLIDRYVIVCAMPWYITPAFRVASIRPLYSISTLKAEILNKL